LDVDAYKVKSFTDNVKAGNPAGVVFESKDLDDNQMKKISEILNVSETAFVYPSEKADYKVRFFSSTVEVELCGHATIALFYLIGKKIGKSNESMISLKQETKVGILHIELYFDDNNEIDYVMMTQRSPLFKQINFNYSKLAEIFGINEDDFNKNIPTQIVSTGLFTLPICVKNYYVLSNICPDYEKVKQFCLNLNVGSIHVFTFDTINVDSLYHARNFAPLYGINEDPVTGTANGAVSSYLHHFNLTDKDYFICEQGDVIGASGRIIVDLRNKMVKIGGKAVVDYEKNIQI
jgi:PhzF family phenazine biosynthesis protein